MNKQRPGALPETFARAMAATRRRAGANEAAPAGMVVALSGGLDSSALLHLAHAYAAEHGIALHAFHIHHGLSPNADAWLDHCEALCATWGIRFEARRVTLQKQAKTGTEEAARNSRYAALGELCREHGVTLLLTAHHQDDQAETVLLQLLRGSGTAGLSGMDAANHAPDLLGHADLFMARPLLSASRKQLEAYVDAHGIGYITDESNADPRFARNALRHKVMPALESAFPGFQERFARSAQHAQSAQRLLTELATQDLALFLDGDCLDIGKLRLLSADRCYNLLRHWFGTRGLRMPTTAWLEQMLTQLLDARPDSRLLVTHPDCDVRRYRDRLHLTPKMADLAGLRDKSDENIPGLEKEGQVFTWQGESQMAFPAYGGTLYFDQVSAERATGGATGGQAGGQTGGPAGARGLDVAWLRQQSLTIDFRKGGERLKPAFNRPTRSLKYHYQANDVPAWERERLPIVSAGTQLLFAAGIGMDCHNLSEEPVPRIALRWVAA